MAEEQRAPHYAVTLRLKPTVGRLLEEISVRMGISKTAAISIALREFAQNHNLPMEKEEATV